MRKYYKNYEFIYLLVFILLQSSSGVRENKHFDERIQTGTMSAVEAVQKC